MYQTNFKILAEISAEVFGQGAVLVRPVDVAARVATGSMTGREVAVLGAIGGRNCPCRVLEM